MSRRRTSRSPTAEPGEKKGFHRAADSHLAVLPPGRSAARALLATQPRAEHGVWVGHRTPGPLAVGPRVAGAFESIQMAIASDAQRMAFSSSSLEDAKPWSSGPRRRCLW